MTTSKFQGEINQADSENLCKLSGKAYRLAEEMRRAMATIKNPRCDEDLTAVEDALLAAASMLRTAGARLADASVTAAEFAAMSNMRRSAA